MHDSKYLHCSGNDYEIGEKCGAFLRAEISDAVSLITNYHAFRKSFPKILPYTACIYALKKWCSYFLTDSWKAYPSLEKRFLGITHGASILTMDLALVHMMEVFGSDVPRLLTDFPPISACSSLAISAPEPLLAKNFDFPDDFRDYGCVRKVLPIEKHASIQVTLSPIVGAHSGINDAGLAITYNFGYSAEKPVRSPLITFLISHILENCSTIEEAIPILAKTPNASSAIVSLVDAAGNVVAIEISPRSFAVIRQKKLTFVNANSYSAPQTLANATPQNAIYGKRAPSSLRGTNITSPNITRTARLVQLTENTSLDSETVRKILCDHGELNAPSELTICRHHESYSTHLSVLMFPAQRKIEYCYGNPCKAETWFTAAL